MNLKWALLGWLAALAATVALEQLLCALLRWHRLRRDPMVSDPQAGAFYQRSLFTFGSAEVRSLWAGLLATATLGWLAWLVHPLWGAPAGAALMASLNRDLAEWECVAASRWQVAWRRGWQRSVRRVPMAQIARVHLVERPPARQDGWLARLRHQLLGTCYLALELHDGRAVKLPRTSRWAGRGAVEQASRFLRRRQRQTVRAHRQPIRRNRPTAAPQAIAAGPEAAERQMRREIAALRAARRHNERQRARAQALSERQELPPPDSRLSAGDTLIPG